MYILRSLKSIIFILLMSCVVSCNTQKGSVSGENPLLERSWDTPFGIPPFEKISGEHFVPAFELAFEEWAADIDSIVSDRREASFESVIWALDNSGERFKDLKDIFEMNGAAISDEGYRRAEEELAPRIAAAIDAVYMNGALFERVEELYMRREELGLDPIQMRLLERTYTKFVRGGALLSESQKGRLAKINAEIALLSTRFSQNLLAENQSFILELDSKQLAGLHSDLRAAAHTEAVRRGIKDRWVITLSPAMMIPFLSQSTQRDLREQIYTAYLKRGANGGETDNREIVRRVTELRQQRAQMLGYKNHAEYVISQQMAGSAAAAYGLLDKIWQPALEGAKAESEELEKLLQRDYDGESLQSWDWWYYTEKLRSEKFRLSSSSVAPYLTLEGVKGGFFTLANRLYGVAFRPVDVPIYSEDCVAYEVVDRDNSHLGILYFDLYPREGKGQGAWCGNIREQRTDGGDRITPVVAVVCNFPRPSEKIPSQLTIEQVETLFHEGGHALHFIFQNVDYRGLAAVEGDFVEFPSQVMENWAMEPELLAMYATHYRSGSPMPQITKDRIAESRLFNQGYETISVAAAALLDLDLQSTTLEELKDFDVEAFENRALRERRGLIPSIEPRYQLSNFAHLFTYDYSAGYYFYLWSEVLDKDCFAAFKESGSIFSQSVAERLRREVLRRGGEADGATLYRNFRGADPSQEHLLRARGLME